MPEYYIMEIIVPVYEGKGNKWKCNMYRSIGRLSVVLKVYERIVTDMVNTNHRSLVSVEQGGFIEGKLCIDQIFMLRIIVACLIDLDKVYDRVDRVALWQMLGNYGIQTEMLKAVQSMYSTKVMLK